MEDLIGAILCTSLLGYGVAVIPLIRAGLFFATYSIPDQNMQHYGIYAITLITSMIYLDFSDVISICIVIFGLYLKDRSTIRTLISFVVPFLILSSILHNEKQAEGLLVITAGMLTHIIQHHHATATSHVTFNSQQISEITRLTEEIETLQKEKKFHDWMLHPQVTKKASVLIKKLRKIKKIVPEVSQSRLNMSHDAISKSTKPSENILDKSLDMNRGFFGGKQDDSNASFLDMEHSNLFSNGKLQQTICEKFVQSELDEIIYSVISREYIMYNEPARRKQVIPVKPDFSQEKFAQPIIQNVAGNITTLAAPRMQNQSISKSGILRIIDDHLYLKFEAEYIGQWNFDTLKYSEQTRSEPISALGAFMFEDLDLIDTFQINQDTLQEFLRDVEKGYDRKNFYHSNIHGADVTNSTIFLLQQGLLKRGAVSDLEILSLVVSALCHDIGHPGVNNAFLVASQDKLAIKYNDISVLESMHASKTFRVLARPTSNIVSQLEQNDWLVFRKLVLELILATDLQKHFGIVSNFKAINESEGGIKMNDDAQRLEALKIAIKCADIAHGAKLLEIHKKWTGLVTKEFFSQGDKERKMGLPVSQLCDRETIVIANSQKGFLSYLVLPIFELWENFVSFEGLDDTEDLEPYLLPVKMIKENLEYWEIESNEQTYYIDDAPSPALINRRSPNPLARSSTSSSAPRKGLSPPMSFPGPIPSLETLSSSSSRPISLDLRANSDAN